MSHSHLTPDVCFLWKVAWSRKQRSWTSTNQSGSRTNLPVHIGLWFGYVPWTEMSSLFAMPIPSRRRKQSKGEENGAGEESRAKREAIYSLGTACLKDHLLPYETSLPLLSNCETLLWVLSPLASGNQREAFLDCGSSIMELPPPWIFICLLLSFTHGWRLFCFMWFVHWPFLAAQVSNCCSCVFSRVFIVLVLIDLLIRLPHVLFLMVHCLDGPDWAKRQDINLVNK